MGVTPITLLLRHFTPFTPHSYIVLPPLPLYSHTQMTVSPAKYLINPTLNL